MSLDNTVVIMNSPPNSGKDVVTEALCKLTGASHGRFKDHLYQCTAVLFNVPVDDLISLATNRDTKEKPHLALQVTYNQYLDLCTVINRTTPWPFGNIMLSPREALIYVSEVVIKPTMGDDYFGKILADNINKDIGMVVSDGGFLGECLTVVGKIGKPNVFIIQMEREGCTFEGDSRDYVYVEGVATLQVDNNSSIQDVVDKIMNFIHNERLYQQETFGDLL